MRFFEIAEPLDPTPSHQKGFQIRADRDPPGLELGYCCDVVYALDDDLARVLENGIRRGVVERKDSFPFHVPLLRGHVDPKTRTLHRGGTADFKALLNVRIGSGFGGDCRVLATNGKLLNRGTEGIKVLEFLDSGQGWGEWLLELDIGAGLRIDRDGLLSERPDTFMLKWDGKNLSVHTLKRRAVPEEDLEQVVTQYKERAKELRAAGGQAIAALKARGAELEELNAQALGASQPTH